MPKKPKIEINEWHYTCADGCCDNYRIEVSVNGVKCEDQHAGECAEKTLDFVLKQLGIEAEIIKTYYK